MDIAACLMIVVVLVVILALFFGIIATMWPMLLVLLLLAVAVQRANVFRIARYVSAAEKSRDDAIQASLQARTAAALPGESMQTLTRQTERVREHASAARAAADRVAELSERVLEATQLAGETRVRFVKRAEEALSQARQAADKASHEHSRIRMKLRTRKAVASVKTSVGKLKKLWSGNADE
jgi:predicted lipid-binding transport protein (Tim44 family)